MNYFSEDICDDKPFSIRPYEILGLEKTATEQEVKTAYRKAALKNHPGSHFMNTDSGFLRS